MRLHYILLRAAGWLVPREQRSDWLAEWTAEVCYVYGSAPERVTTFCLGAFRDAFWLRRNSPPAPPGASFLGSPYSCLLFLAFLAAAAVFFPFPLPWPPGDTPSRPPTGALALWLVAVTPIAVLCVWAVWRGVEILEETLAEPRLIILDLQQGMRLPLERSPANVSPGAVQFRRWAFMAAKSALLALIAGFGIIDLGPAASLGVLFSYCYILRWAIADQRQRCPVCLRRVTHPTRIGEASHMFLEWYGTEFVCDQGHGLLHVPEIPTSCYSTDHWVTLDPSWSSLFAAELSGRASG